MKNIEEIYQELLQNDKLQDEMVEAALSGGVESFFRARGCEVSEDEVWEFFRMQIIRRGELSDTEMEIVSGGAGNSNALAKMVRFWADNIAKKNR